MNEIKRFKIGQAVVDFNSSHITNSQGSDFIIEPKVMKVLDTLVQQRGQVVSRDSLMDTVWGKASGGDEGLTRAVSILRKAFGDSLECKNYIQTVPKRGYCLKASMLDCPKSEIELSETPPLSLAVLPLVDFTSDQSFDYLCDGISEEIINELTQLNELKVSGRTSSFSFKGKNQDIRSIAQALNVAYILEGSLRKHGDQLCITIQLVDGASGFHVYSKNYKGEFHELLSFEEKIAYSVAWDVSNSLDIKPSDKNRAQKVVNSDAYQLFLRGKQLTHKLNGQNTIPSGIDYLQRAVDIDPQFSDAFAWLALAHFILPEFSKTSLWAQHITKSKLAYERALEIDPNSSVAWLVKAMYLTREFELDKALECYEHALALDPNNIETMAGMGLGLMAIGKHDKAKYHLERVIENDPLCGIWHTTYGGILLACGESDLAEKHFLRSFNLGFGAAAFGVSQLMAERGDIQQAVAFMQDHSHALGPVEGSELQSKVIRSLLSNAYLKHSPFAKSLVTYALKRRLCNKLAQPTAASVISFLFLKKPNLFMDSILTKPNPYLGYTIARIWEPTSASQQVRMHPDFSQFIDKTKLVKAWQKYGWPSQIKPDDGDASSSQYTIIG